MQLQTNKQSAGEREGEREKGGKPVENECLLHILTHPAGHLHRSSPCRHAVGHFRLHFAFTVHLAVCLSLALSPSRCLFLCCLACLDIFPLISVAIQLNLACLIYLINFFLPATPQNCHSLFSLFYLHFLLSFSFSSSLLSPSFCLKKLPAPTWPQSFRDFHLSSSRRQSAPFFAILIVYKWLTLFFIVCRTHRQRERESE